ncbi:MAG: Ig-like domain-containing protein, partial [Gemmatimonadales bacterium]
IAGLLVSGGCGGGGDGGTPPVTVASVLITAPPTAPSFATLGRTAQFAAVAKDAGGATLGSATITWSSSNAGAASVNGAGLVTAVGNGSTTITATSGGVPSPGVMVTVSQVANSMTLSPATISFGAIGSTRQVSASLKDSAGNSMITPAPTFTNAASGKTSVNSTGLVTALGNTTVADSILVQVTSGATIFSSPVVVTVQQVAVSVTVSSTGIDTLKTTGSTKQYTAVVKDSGGNVMGSAPVTWSSTTTATATVNSGTGLVTAAADGSTNITATSGSANGLKALTVRRFAKTFSLSPNTPQSVAVAGGFVTFTGTAQDSNLTNLAITWTSRNTAVVTMSAASGTSGGTSNATAVHNGSTYVVLSGGTLSDSAQVTTSNQPTAPMSAAVNIGDDFFTSVANSTSNPAVDTIAAGGTVQWTWHGAIAHGVQSTGTPSFTGSTTQVVGTYQFTFLTSGTYTYDCIIHGAAMTGRIVVQ